MVWRAPAAGASAPQATYFRTALAPLTRDSREQFGCRVNGGRHGEPACVANKPSMNRNDDQTAPSASCKLLCPL